MAISSTGITGRNSDWGSDFFGTLNEMPPEPVNGIGHILEAMSTLPAFRDARFTQDNFSVRHHRFQRNILQCGWKYSTPYRQDQSAYANGLGKIAGHVAESREE